MRRHAGMPNYVCSRSATYLSEARAKDYNKSIQRADHR